MRSGQDEGSGALAVAGATPSVRELEDWPVLPCPVRPIGRDVALDLLRGLAMVILVVNHAGLSSWLAVGTSSVLSAAETLVPVSGVAVGMVFGRRWARDGGWAVTRQLWARARSIYVAAVVLGALVGLATLVPGLATDAVTVTRHGRDLYAFDGAGRTLLAVLTLEAGPWQTCILAFFVVTLLVAPALLWVLARGGWWVLLAGSVGTYAGGRALGVDVLPVQSEGPFPVLVWQVLFVPALVVGYHRRTVAAGLRRARGAFGVTVGAIAVAAACLQVGLAPAAALRWQAAHFEKAPLDPLRILVMASLALSAYLLLRRLPPVVERGVRWVLEPLGRSSFYVFLVHVPLCIVLATLVEPLRGGAGAGMLGNSLVLVAGVAVLLVLVRREVLFRWIPR
jgi:hypothetical protein